MVSLIAPETLVWPLPLQTNDVRPLGLKQTNKPDQTLDHVQSASRAQSRNSQNSDRYAGRAKVIRERSCMRETTDRRREACTV